ncbi:TonB-dependent receptor plug domain-containing protein [Phenylobacterium sp.]|uniref:TonB-dependent receptor plug domain-containing protein n=1 Tax=Phenylobacterium sp. TaxID=1871053 RepID=UPI002FE1A122
MKASRATPIALRLQLAMGASLIALGAGGQAWAQEGAEVGEVIVTGSRIVRDGFDAPTPVTVVDRDQLTASTPTSIPDALNKLPQFQRSSTPASAGPSANANAGGNYLNLRALGVSRTLVLLDGRRSVPSNSSSATDVNLIPQALVQRVDIVTGGASAAYGSDAVAGVVNFVLDTQYEGLKGELQGGISRYEDDKSYKVNLTGGRKLLDGRAHIVASGEFAKRDGFQYAHGRDWIEASWGPINTPSGVPTTFITRDAAISTGTYGGLVTSGPFANQQFLPGGVLAPYDRGTGTTTSFQIGGDGVQDVAGLPTSLTYGTFFTHATFDVSDTLQLFAEGTYGQSITQFISTNPNTTAGNAFTIYADNAFLPAALRAQLLATNTPSFRLGRIDRDFGRANFHVRNLSYNFVTGLKADLFDGWQASAYYEHGETIQRIQTRSNTIYENAYRAADAVVGPGGQIVCRSTLTTPSDGCVPVNLFGDGAPSQAARDYITGTSYSKQTVKQDVLAAQISGEPFALPAGPVSLAAGAEYRKVSTRQISDSISQSRISATNIRGLPATLDGVLGGFILTNPQPSRGSYDIKEVFAETVVPLLRDQAFAHSLELNAAIRYTDYSISGGVTTWKVGGTWEPIPDLRLRATRSRDIRAANFGELFAGTTQSQGQLRDPQQGNALVRFFNRRQGNPNLDPERADTTTAGFVYRPSWFEGFSFAVDAYKISIDDAISLPTPQDVVNACAAGSTEQCALVSRTAAGAIQAVLTPFQNAASVKQDGVDVEIAYRRDLFDGAFGARLLASTIGRNETTLAGAAPVDRAGDLGNSVATITNGTPRWTGALALSWQRGPLELFLQERYVSKGYYDHRLQEGAQINDNTIPAVFYTDVTAKYDFEVRGRELEAFVTINNLFDKDPPPAPSVTTATFYPTNNFIYDLSGRYYTVGLRFDF